MSEVGRRTAAEAARAIADALSAAGYDYAIGGALALGVAGVPRGTKDVDINLFVGKDELGGAIDVLAALGIELSPEHALARAERDGMFVGVWDGMRVDVFVPSIPFSHEAGETVRVITIDGWTGRFLAPEAIALFKLLFFRLKDRGDLERLVAVRGADLDHAYVRRWIVEMMGEDDERSRAWDDIVARFGPHDG
ncbi:MAG: hypothetical protein KF729_35490 [Sandaracinaceae bacterium]|nr:hypothetical protein [Sandaracinaceae bacterium]